MFQTTNQDSWIIKFSSISLSMIHKIPLHTYSHVIADSADAGDDDGITKRQPGAQPVTLNCNDCWVFMEISRNSFVETIVWK